MYTFIWLLLGAILALPYVACARRRPRAIAVIYGSGLIVAACIYPLFALAANASSAWLAMELVGVALYGAMALAGMRWSGWWLVLGWGLHPLWDLGLHLLGPGAHLVPAWYALACLSFDLIVAAHAALVLAAGANRSPR